MKALVVVLEEDAPSNMIFAMISSMLWVQSVTDLSAISQETLDTMLLPRSEAYSMPSPRPKRRKKPPYMPPDGYVVTLGDLKQMDADPGFIPGTTRRLRDRMRGMA